MAFVQYTPFRSHHSILCRDLHPVLLIPHSEIFSSIPLQNNFTLPIPQPTYILPCHPRMLVLCIHSFPPLAQATAHIAWYIPSLRPLLLSSFFISPYTLSLVRMHPVFYSGCCVLTPLPQCFYAWIHHPHFTKPLGRMWNGSNVHILMIMTTANSY